MTWVIMPFLNGIELALDAIHDVLAQTVPTKILVVGQGISNSAREAIEQISEESDRVFAWFFEPALPSLAGVWNRALRFVWETGGEEALVINHDLRLHPQTIEQLRIVLADELALFVSAVGVREGQFDPTVEYPRQGAFPGDFLTKGGPDFSCFLISRACHDTFPFDEHFIPAFGEDLDYHRRLMLADEGSRIFSVNLPFLHLGGGSQTLKTMDPQVRQATEAQINGISRAYYARKWGGPVNQETYLIPFDPTSAVEDGSATTPALQAAVQGAAHA